MFAEPQRLFRLDCQAQNYAWGKVGSASLVAQYVENNGVAIDPSQPYAELWMGTHPNAPSRLRETTTNNSTSASAPTLASYLALNSNARVLLGSPIYEKFGGELPFLFKVLSVAQALSIQAHPDKQLAEQLHRQFPQHYKDANHKPEMAIGLTPFEMLCGFRNLPVIVRFLRDYPPLAELLGETIVQDLQDAAATEVEGVTPLHLQADQHRQRGREALQALFHGLMTQEPEPVRQCIDALLAIKQPADHPVDILELLRRLNHQYPGDVGCLCIFVLNYFCLRRGEAIFLGANEPHAYLFGDCIECMATSDNVVRAGLTPKFRDVNTLVNMLTYTYGEAQDHIMEGTPAPAGSDPQVHVTVYDPPIPEFTVARVNVASGGSAISHELDPIPGPSIILVTEGQGQIAMGGGVLGEHTTTPHLLQPGLVYFVGADTPISITNLAADNTDLVFYRAFCTVEH
ncbi:Mannose-6-phosphate isomerase [Dimargaris cristalligena]|uniref:Mannose-6-phosphate isomerase n=1 Tax=Dimargaris cristalligena TaxID=215637 RepID=A0A4P9ZW14_9FUNG|nr:Mannose-6-phosphate isomerase [Dimargaris cristalligena]RKP37478.1 RmlC-like cupin domain-containing protein [Dimargaris cristalligena]|eukprot:RKP37478.1 RmlC-like cupin domain-containing protein [Dimargaris cristalligena]